MVKKAFKKLAKRNKTVPKPMRTDKMVAVNRYRITFTSGSSTKVLQGKFLGTFRGCPMIDLRPKQGTLPLPKDSVISFEYLPRENYEPLVPKNFEKVKRELSKARGWDND